MASHLDPTGLSRRRLLQIGGTLAAVWGTGALAGCSSDDPKSSSDASAGKPVKGGVLTLGMIGSGAAEQLDPLPYSTGYPDIVRQYCLYDSLFFAGAEFGQIDPGLAVSAEPNATADEWILTLRDGVEFHDGKPFGAEDVVYTLQQWGLPTSAANASMAPFVDFKGVRQDGPLTVRVPLVRPVAQFDTLLVSNSCLVIQAGSKSADRLSAPVGTGPFVFESLTPGKTSTFNAFDSYWDEGKPYVDQVVVNSSFDDENARLNALLSGAINVLPLLTPLQTKQNEGSSQIQVKTSETGITRFFSMNTDKEPFGDERIRQAIRLAADRQALVDGALSGYGVPAYDLFGRGSKYFAQDLVREQNLEEAKSLLASAGAADLQIEISTSNAVAGFVEAATLLSEQLKGAGIDAKVKVIPAANYFLPSSGFPHALGMDTTTATPSLSAVWSLNWLPYEGGSAAMDPDQLNQAMAAIDPQQAEQLWTDYQQWQFDKGAFLGWADGDAMDAMANGVQGLGPTKAGSLNGYRLVDGWIS